MGIYHRIHIMLGALKIVSFVKISQLIILIVLRLKSFSSKLTFKKEKKKKRENQLKNLIYFLLDTSHSNQKNKIINKEPKTGCRPSF